MMPIFLQMLQSIWWG